MGHTMVIRPMLEYNILQIWEHALSTLVIPLKIEPIKPATIGPNKALD